MPDDRLPCVLRAARGEATSPREELGKRPLIRGDTERSGSRRRVHAGRPARQRSAIAPRAPFRSRTSASNGPVRAGRRATMTRSPGVGSAPRATRYASRSRRRTRFRVTALRICRLTANPTRRARSLSFHNTIKDGRSMRAPCWKTAWKSRLPVSRSRRGSRPKLSGPPTARRSGAFAPSRAAASAPSGPPASSSAPGSRVSSFAGACSAGTCASLDRGLPFSRTT